MCDVMSVRIESFVLMLIKQRLHVVVCLWNIVFSEALRVGLPINDVMLAKE
jgi:hypothetical protein